MPVLAVRALVPAPAPAPPPARGCRKLPDRRSVDRWVWIYWLHTHTLAIMAMANMAILFSFTGHTGCTWEIVLWRLSALSL